uniref:O-phosphoseryl-tRNA(Sec) selenium transferase n=1 Tax=Ciona intestinalis TaxID=7719 RepID=UPI00005231BC|nr:O-phosphoseryl-tRNA(Sec) selenium transferase [Ciona intestinalis]|eukprot:XP_002120570.1 O-phosphoseryl-tRNA(Sec) selenium transferase [Ciona intestinalis]
MEASQLEKCANLVPSSYIAQGQQFRTTRSNMVRILLEKQKVPEEGWEEEMIEFLLGELSQLDSNNALGNCGAGEREGRIFSSLVARRNYRLAHGVGRSGDVTAVQPKAIGSSILNKLCTKLMLDMIRIVGARNAKSCIIVPMATGMTLLLCFLALRSLRPNAKYIIWPRIDQKSCFKSMTSSGFEPIIIENKLEGDELRTDVSGILEAIKRVGADNVLCVHSTTSCFAPRVPDRLEEISLICKEHDIPHIVNNAYGLQSSKCMHLLQQASRVGRVDAFVQSCDKNFLVPVGGAIVASFNNDSFLDKVASTYAGRASSAPAIDLLITMLNMGVVGMKKLLAERKENYSYLKQELTKLAAKHDEKLLETSHNPISMAMTLSSLEASNCDVTQLGSMLFTRRVTGARVVQTFAKKEIEGHVFTGYGSHSNHYPHSYVTVAAAIGMRRTECDVIVKCIDKCMTSLKKKKSNAVGQNLTENNETNDATNLDVINDDVTN